MVTNFDHFNLTGATPEKIKSVLSGYCRTYGVATVSAEAFAHWLAQEYIPKLETCRKCGADPSLKALKDPAGLIRAYIYVCPNCGRTALPYISKLASAINWNDQNGEGGHDYD